MHCEVHDHVRSSLLRDLQPMREECGVDEGVTRQGLEAFPGVSPKWAQEGPDSQRPARYRLLVDLTAQPVGRLAGLGRPLVAAHLESDDVPPLPQLVLGKLPLLA